MTMSHLLTMKQEPQALDKAFLFSVEFKVFHGSKLSSTLIAIHLSC